MTVLNKKVQSIIRDLDGDRFWGIESSLRSEFLNTRLVYNTVYCMKNFFLATAQDGVVMTVKSNQM